MAAATWNYTPNQKAALKISRSRIQMFLDCPRCFWLIMRHKIKRPSMPDFLLNQAVDHLLKREFDIYRHEEKAHPLMKKNKLKAVPFQHKDLDQWRNPFEGVQYLVEEHNFLIFGGIDDVWIDDQEQLIIVDYKATAKDEPVVKLYEEGSYHDSYRRQLEVYQWLLMKNGFKVNPTAYFVYATGVKDKPDFSNKLHFALNLIAHKGESKWIDETLKDIKSCLDGSMPKFRSTPACEHCNYVLNRLKLGNKLKESSK